MRLSAAVLSIGLATSATAAPVKPWVADADLGCNWRITGPDDRSLVASIEQGDELMLTLDDPAFLGWSELERPQIELTFDQNPGKRVLVKGWATHGVAGSTSSTFGLYLDAATRRALGGARRLVLRRGGRPVIDLPLAATPDAAELDACVPPKDKHSDEE